MTKTEIKILPTIATHLMYYGEKGTLVTKTGIGPCTGTHDPCTKMGKWQRQRTCYANDQSNWVCLCEECATENDEYWKSMWDDYYSSIA